MEKQIPTNSIFENYFNSQYSYNELLGQDGNLQPYWQTFFLEFDTSEHLVALKPFAGVGRG